jgi:diguanylate cyclase (GGDEF)-like protein
LISTARNDAAFKIKEMYLPILDSLTEQLVVIDSTGFIQWVNRSWQQFFEENGGSPGMNWQERNYLHICNGSAVSGVRDGASALMGIKEVISSAMDEFYFEYPCHSPTENRWFTMLIRRLVCEGPSYFVISHHDITKRKLAEIKVEQLAIIDDLTGLANRRHFDAFLQDQWRRAQRLNSPMSLLFIDIDFFKPYNDNYGHMTGDECLRLVGEALKSFSRRPNDLIARYGGEEFCLILGNTEIEYATKTAEDVRNAIQSLSIVHDYATDAGCVTVSIGVATKYPGKLINAKQNELVEAADAALYKAKESGRNCVCCS